MDCGMRNEFLWGGGREVGNGILDNGDCGGYSLIR